MNRIEVKFKDGFTPHSGITSQVSWQNEDLKKAMNILFGKNAHEEIVGIVVDDSGIRAHFVHCTNSPKTKQKRSK